MNFPMRPQLSDGVIFLRPHIAGDAADHLAGEDSEMAKWLSGGRSTLANVEAFIQRSQESWRSGGQRRPFGVFECATNRLIGFVEANLGMTASGQANISYGIFQPWRGQGLALRALDLMDRYLRTETQVQQMVIRISPANTASLRVAEKAGFTLCGVYDEPEGRLVRYVRDLTP